MRPGVGEVGHFDQWRTFLIHAAGTLHSSLSVTIRPYDRPLENCQKETAKRGMVQHTRNGQRQVVLVVHHWTIRLESVTSSSSHCHGRRNQAPR